MMKVDDMEQYKEKEEGQNLDLMIERLNYY
jgi:hypothetical protein